MSGLVRLEGGVDGAAVRRLVGQVGAALPPGLGQDSVQEAGGAVRSRRGSVRRAAEAVLPQQLRGAETAAEIQNLLTWFWFWS